MIKGYRQEGMRAALRVEVASDNPTGVIDSEGLSAGSGVWIIERRVLPVA